jgi:hypothetical protein
VAGHGRHCTHVTPLPVSTCTYGLGDYRRAEARGDDVLRCPRSSYLVALCFWQCCRGPVGAEAIPVEVWSTSVVEGVVSKEGNGEQGHRRWFNGSQVIAIFAIQPQQRYDYEALRTIDKY